MRFPMYQMRLHSQILASFGIGSYGFISPIHNPPFNSLDHNSRLHVLQLLVIWMFYSEERLVLIDTRYKDARSN
jgi:hypothetical protein